jgi:putative ABC transport system ATP-binding protein
MTVPIIHIADLVFAWKAGESPVLQIDTLEIGSGERIFIEGPSGSGKTTLLSLLGAVVRPGSGSVRIMERETARLSGAARDRFRADHVGFIFQMFNLIPYLSTVENVLLPCHFSSRRREKASRGNRTIPSEAARLLSRLGLAGSATSRPVTELSVGQQQRAAAARALIGSPEIVIADEPTSSLDADARRDFLELLFEECRQAGSTLVFVSHDHSLGALFDRRVALRDINRARRSSR